MDNHETINNGNSNRNIIITVIAGIAVIIAVVFYLNQTGTSHYDKGAELLKDKQYSEALSEFQKVEPGDKNFAQAQSKINYINGLIAYNNGLIPDATVYLSKVAPDDEYYHDSQLMLQKIADRNSQENLQSQIDSLKRKKDTVVIKVKTPDEKEKEARHNLTDAQINKNYISGAEGMINKFEPLYESAKGSSVESKKQFVKDMSSVYSQFSSLSYNAVNKDGDITELQRLTGSWMNKRISFINKLIAENSISETNNSRASKEEGDKAYNIMMNLLHKVKSSH